MSSVQIHPSAVVDAEAKLGRGVVIGPLCVVGAEVELGDGVHLIAHCSVLGPAKLGPGCTVFPHATVGAAPQDRSYHGEHTTLEVGAHTVMREGVTIHRGTIKGGGHTRVGSSCLLMVGAHVAHDCVVGDHSTLANYTSLGGHVELGHHVTTGGHVAVAPFCRIGDGAFLAGGTMVERSVPPYVIAGGHRSRIRGINRVGLSRMGVPAASIDALVAAYKRLFIGDQPLKVALTEVALSADPYVATLVAELVAIIDGRPRPDATDPRRSDDDS